MLRCFLSNQYVVRYLKRQFLMFWLQLQSDLEKLLVLIYFIHLFYLFIYLFIFAENKLVDYNKLILMKQFSFLNFS